MKNLLRLKIKILLLTLFLIFSIICSGMSESIYFDIVNCGEGGSSASENFIMADSSIGGVVQSLVSESTSYKEKSGFVQPWNSFSKFGSYWLVY